MKKFLFLFVFAVVALVVDGSLTYDLLDARKENLKIWLFIGLALVLVVVVFLADASKNHDNKDNPE